MGSVLKYNENLIDRYHFYTFVFQSGFGDKLGSHTIKYTKEIDFLKTKYCDKTQVEKCQRGQYNKDLLYDYLVEM